MKASASSSVFLRTAKRAPILLGVLFLLFLSFGTLFIPVKAAAVTLCDSSAVTLVWPATAPANPYPVTGSWSITGLNAKSCNVVGNVLVLSFACINPCSLSSVTDGASNTWSILAAQSSDDNKVTLLTIWTTLTTTATSLTLTITGTGTAGLYGETNTSAQVFTNISNSSGTCGGSFVGTANTGSCTFTFNANSVVVGTGIDGSSGARSFTWAPNSASISGTGSCSAVYSFCDGFANYAINLGSGTGTFSLVCSTGCSANAHFVFSFILFNNVAASSTGSTTVGQCPPKNTATTTLANNTGYFYEANTLGGSTVNDLNTFLASNTLGGATTNSVVLSLYVGTAGSGAVSISNPLVYITGHTFTIHMGDKNQPLSTSVGTFITQANTPYAILIQGTDKIKINQSTLAGMFSVATSGTTPPATITSLGANGAELYLCMHVSFQLISTTVTTSTVTTTTGGTNATSTFTSTVTSTTVSTATTFNLAQGSATLPQLLLAIIVIFGPALLIAGITRSLWGGIMGVTLGVIVGVFVGIVPFWAVAVIIFMVVAVLIFAARSSSGGGVS